MKKQICSMVAMAFCCIAIALSGACGDNNSSGSEGNEKADSTFDVNMSSGNIVKVLENATGEITVNVKAFAELKTNMQAQVYLGGENTTKITINGGTEGATLRITGYGVSALCANSEGELVFKNITIEDNTNQQSGWNNWATEFGGKIRFENCTFKQEVLLRHDAKATFTDCTFTSTDSSRYAFWLQDGSATLTNCEISGYRGIKVHENSDEDDVVKLIVERCTFAELKSKPGLAFGTLDATTEVVVQNSTFISCNEWDNAEGGSLEGIDGFYESDGQLTSTFTFSYSDNDIDGTPCSELTPQYNIAE